MTAAELTALRKKYPADKMAKIRTLFDKDVQNWAPIKHQRDLDMQCISTEDDDPSHVAGPWPTEEWNTRHAKETARPCLHEDVLTPYINQVINKIEMNPMGIEASPAGDGADESTAEFVEDRIRGLEYEENATFAYNTAALCAVQGSYGWFKAETRYGGGSKSKLAAASYGGFSQKICVIPITDPNTIIPGFFKRPDASDMRRAWEIEWMTEEEFREKHPDAEIQRGFKAGFGDNTDQAAQWLNDGKVQVCAWWHLESDERNLMLVDDGSDTGLEVLESDAPDTPKEKILKRRKERSHKIVKTITNGIEVLGETEWIDPGEGEDILPEIPIYGIFGRIKYERDGKLTIESLVRKGRVGQLFYNFCISSIAEEIAQTPKTKVWGPENTFDTTTDWEHLGRSPFAYGEYKITYAEDGSPLPGPELISYEPKIAALQLAKDSIVIGIANAIGMSSVERKDKAAKSGKALDALTEEMTIGTSHYFGATRIAQERFYRMLLRCLPLVENTDRQVALRDKFGKVKMSQLPENAYSARHTVAVAAGKMYQTMQDKQKEFSQELLKAAGGDGPIVIVALMGAVKMAGLGEYGDETYDSLMALLQVQFPEVAKAMSKDEQEQPIPPEAMQAIQTMRQQLEAMDAHAKQLETQIIEMEEDLKAQKVKADSQERISTADNETKVKIEEMRANLQVQLKAMEIELKKIDLERERLRGSIAAETTGMKMSHESTEAERNRQHTSQEAAVAREHEAATAAETSDNG